MAAVDAAGRRTRRRGRDLLDAIYAGTLDELAESGYAGFTMEGVAARAGTGKAPLYRRWPSKDALILDTVHHGMPTGQAVAYSGNLREDLLTMLRGLGSALASSIGGAMRALLAETHRRPELLDALHRVVFDPRGRELRALLSEAAAHGEIRPEVVDSELVTIGHELIMLRFLTDGPPVPDDTITGILDEVLMPLLTGTFRSPAE